MIWQFWRNADRRRPGTARSFSLLTVVALLTFLGAHAQEATRTQLQVARTSSAVTLEAHVSDLSSNALNSGSVSFETAKGSLGSAFVANGEASLTTSQIPGGTQSVTAVYHPATTSYASSASPQVEAQATSTVPAFTVTANPSSSTVAPGDFATTVLTITSQNGFNGAVSLSCSNLPAEATCTFTPNNLTPPANGTITSSLQIATNAPSGVTKNAMPTRPGEHSSHLYYAFLPGGIALLSLVGLRRRNATALRLLAIFALLGVGMMSLTACGARYDYLKHKPFPNYGTPAGNYSVIISAYSSSASGIVQATTSTSSGCTGAVCIALTVQ